MSWQSHWDKQKHSIFILQFFCYVIMLQSVLTNRLVIHKQTQVYYGAPKSVVQKHHQYYMQWCLIVASKLHPLLWGSCSSTFWVYFKSYTVSYYFLIFELILHRLENIDYSNSFILFEEPTEWCSGIILALTTEHSWQGSRDHN